MYQQDLEVYAFASRILHERLRSCAQERVIKALEETSSPERIMSRAIRSYEVAIPGLPGQTLRESALKHVASHVKTLAQMNNFFDKMATSQGFGRALMAYLSDGYNTRGRAAVKLVEGAPLWTCEACGVHWIVHTSDVAAESYPSENVCPNCRNDISVCLIRHLAPVSCQHDDCGSVLQLDITNHDALVCSVCAQDIVVRGRE